MKRLFLGVLIAVVCFSSCMYSEPDRVVIPDKSSTLQWRLLLDETLLPFGDTRVMPPCLINEPQVKGGGGEELELTDLCQTIEYLVFDLDDAYRKVKHKVYEPEDEDFGIVYDSLPAGNYQFVLMAHKAEASEVIGQVMTFGQLSDTFYHTFTEEISVGEEVIVEKVLSRIVGMIEFVSTDQVPVGAEQLVIDITDYPCGLDLLTGYGIPSEEVVRKTFLFDPEDIGQSGHTHGFYAFVPEEGAGMGLVLRTQKAGDVVMNERTVTDVLPVANRIRRYTGRLYTASDSEETFEITIADNGAWGEPIEENLE
ncbi:hypothetical protein [Parabacteroides sp. PF5-9]|uniref:hypothetical protein n=1 Tax=Parabacteroides sp. PF5-9 TaxID=1742404 RepID=UPI002475972E|nr:hypothetical protein [Parabacteroides sp. PF5-9]MDH6356692.1 hypothetical protein [Parabacteroides sp. PF5-9]